MKILTFNVGLLSIRLFRKFTLLEPARMVEERLAAIPNQLRSLDADIVLLQEVYSKSHKNRLVELLSDAYPNVAYDTINAPRRLLPCSLMIFSKYPLHGANFVRFKAGLWDERLLDSKGFLTANVLNTPLGSIKLYNVHTTAGAITHPEHPRIDEVRMAQIEQLIAHSRFAKPDETLILGGDFNCGPSYSREHGSTSDSLNLKGIEIAADKRVSIANYRRITQHGFTDSFAQLQIPEAPTWTPTENPLNAGGTHSDWGCPAQRIDHIFINNHAVRAISGGIVFQQPIIRSRTGEMVPLSDHYGYMVELEQA